MADLQVTVEKIHEIKEHPNADRMELAIIGGEGGYQCCVQKGRFKAGDNCVYFPVDSVLPEKVESAIFGPYAKVKLSKSRVKQIRLRGAISQGLAVPPEVLGMGIYRHGSDLTKELGVKKWEPSQKGSPTQGAKKSTPKNVNPSFDKYTDIQHLKKYPEVLKGKLIVAFEKVHGTNFRAGWVPFHPKNLFQRVLKRLGLLRKKYQFVYGSHNVQLQGKYRKKDFYSLKENVDVYTKIVKQYDLMNKLRPGEVIYGEIFGGRIQKGYTYGLKDDEHRLAVFDLKHHGKFVNVNYLIAYSIARGFVTPPILYFGTFNWADLDREVQGPSKIPHPEEYGRVSQEIREGLVVRTQEEETGHCGRLVFKYLNPDYLDLQGKGKTSEYH